MMHITKRKVHLFFKHEGTKFLYFYCGFILLCIIHKRVKSALYVSCNYREWLRVLAPICEIKPCGLKTCPGNKDIAG